MTDKTRVPFHGSSDLRELPGRATAAVGASLIPHTLVPIEPPKDGFYQFFPHFHPYVDALVDRLLDRSVAGLQGADTEFNLRNPDGSPVLDSAVLFDPFFRPPSYKPEPKIAKPYPVKDLDFTTSGAYSLYNWEIFFQIPLLVAIHLSRNQRYEEAQRWFHFLFDPTDSGEGPAPQRFWKVRPFLDLKVRSIEEILVNLATPEDLSLPPAERQARAQLKADTIAAISALKDTPFQPWLVARYRPTAYMLKTVMAYLDNLIAWGDSLFQQDTGETINEATQIYVLASQILGPRPQKIPRKGKVPVKSYKELTKLDEFGNMLVEIEAEIPFDITPATPPSGGTPSIGQSLLFCVPRNDKLLGYWDTVSDRLFKIRNSLNLQGIFREVPLFAPPIDPALLVRAAASGLDIGSVLAGLNQPLPRVRFQLLVQKAAEVCQEVKSLGGQLLSIQEKEDGEALSVLRARQELVVLSLGESVRYGQLQEAIKNREGVERSLSNAVQRYRYYERLLGRDASAIQIPGLDAFSQEDVKKLALKVSEPELPPREIEIDIADGNEGEGYKISSHEAKELELMRLSLGFQDAASVLESIGAFLNLIPQFSGDVKPIGMGAGVAFGGWNIGQMMQGLAGATRAVSVHLSAEANKTAKIAGYARREQEWAFQSNLAAGEINGLFKQLRASQIREAVADLELRNQRQQLRNAQEIETFLTSDKKGKKTNQGFYTYLKREVRALYNQFFNLAFDLAKKAERALQHELGNPDLVFVKGGYLAGREGLLGGEKLYLDLKRMEVAYQDLNLREYELTRHVSLLQIDPVALVTLRATGRCTVNLPEEIFDFDGPGHYFRRIKSVAVSLPCVTGPYASISCRLTLNKSWIRKRPSRAEKFEEVGVGDQTSIVTSSGQNDSGLFETNLRDERYLPFEGAGAISQWTLALPDGIRQFDYDTLADVLLHVRYTAREGGDSFRKEVEAHLREVILKPIRTPPESGMVRLLSVRHEFPTDWARFKSLQPATGKTLALKLNLREEHYPLWSQSGSDRSIKETNLFAKGATKEIAVFKEADNLAGQKTEISTKLRDLLTGELGEKEEPGGEKKGVPLPSPIGPWSLHFNSNDFSDLWIALTWTTDLPAPPT